MSRLVIGGVHGILCTELNFSINLNLHLKKVMSICFQDLSPEPLYKHQKIVTVFHIFLNKIY